MGLVDLDADVWREKQLKAGKWFGALVWFCCHEGRVSSRCFHASFSWCVEWIFAGAGGRSGRWPAERGKDTEPNWDADDVNNSKFPMDGSPSGRSIS